MEGRTLRRQGLRGQFRDGGENRRGRRQEGLGVGGRNLLEGMREEPAGDGTGWVTALSEGELYRGEGAAFLRAQRTGGTVRIKEAEGILRVRVQGDRKNPDVSSQKSVSVPAACTPSYPLLRWAPAPVPHPHQVQQEQWGVAVP